MNTKNNNYHYFKKVIDNSKQNFLNRVRVQKDLEGASGESATNLTNIDTLVSEIAELSPEDQQFLFEQCRSLSETNDELLKSFVTLAPKAFSLMESKGVQKWVDNAITMYDNKGLGSAVEIIEQVEQYAEEYSNRDIRCDFDEASTFIRNFVTGLGGRELKLAVDSESFTDTESLYLPDSFDLFPVAEKNFSLYKLTATHLWAQTWYGTWRSKVVEKILKTSDTNQRLAKFNRLECIRLEAQIERDLPGLYRQFRAMDSEEAEGEKIWADWKSRARELQKPGAKALDSLELVDEFAEDIVLPPLQPYQGEMHVNKVYEILSERIEREKEEFQSALQDLIDDENSLTEGTDDSSKKIELELIEDEDGGAGETKFQMSLDGEILNIPEHLQDLLGSIMQDLGEIPEDYMEPNENGEYSDRLAEQAETDENDVSTDAEDGEIFRYDEWDCTRQRFRQRFCSLRELSIPLAESEFVDETLIKYKGILKSIKRTFEAILGENRLQRRQLDGDDIDLDAVIDSFADLVSGNETSEYLYTRYRNKERNIAVMFMIDMSGSTLGWVNDAERESLVLLCEALELLGDRYAIYGFSGRTNKRCEVYKIKEFGQKYSDEVKQRISGIRPKAYTRMGVAIRHLGHLLNQTQARTKLLITLSDGRPEDYGGYKGKYGIEDTRHALLEIKQAGIHPFCITIDNEAQDYLPYMYGKVNYAVIDEVPKLPYKVADIYRRLTT